MSEYTKNFNLELINFNLSPWHDKEHANLTIIDALLAQVAYIASNGVWENATAYTVGQRLFDDVSGYFYEVLIAHTSAASGTFAADRLANPTYWGSVNNVPNHRGAWTTTTLYFANDVVSNGTGTYWCLATHTSGTFATDLAASKWMLIFSSAVSASTITNTPAGTIAATNVQAAINELDTEKQAVSEKNNANGYAGLDGSGLISTSQLPALAISTINIVASEAAMLALSAQQGDVAIRTDLNKSFALSTNSPTTLADWKELLTPTDAVLSVAGLTGAISAAGLKTAMSFVVGDISGALAANNPVITGVATIPVGAVGSPSVTFSGDTNSGFYSPAADQVGVTAGGTLIANFKLAGIDFAKPIINNFGDNSASYDTNVSHATYASYIYKGTATRTATTSFAFLGFWSGGGADREFMVDGTGATYGDGSYTVGADYAEAFEWLDGNEHDEDRVGFSVVLVGRKVRKATEEDNKDLIVGVVSGVPSVVGDAAWNMWTGKYLRDDFGRHILNDKYEKILNPQFDPNEDYTPRLLRKEFSPIGLVGKLRLRKGQPTGTRWIKLRDITQSVEEWLVR